MKTKVFFSVCYVAYVESDADDLYDAIADIDIPENDTCKYVEDSFIVEETEVEDSQ